MQQIRRQRLEKVIQEELSTVVRELKDPRIPTVTFTAVELTPDAEQATVFVTILGGVSDDSDGRKRMRDCLDGLKSASGFLKKRLAGVLNIRHVPQLAFKEDKGIENAIRVHELLKKIDSSGS